MDVQCERCRTEYDFDDALVSARGTTVRCTHCDHRFKVRPATGGRSLEDRWLVVTASGEKVKFGSLRDLQEAILSKQIRRSDALVHGDGPPRPLGEITELEPLFEGRASSRPRPADLRPEPSRAVALPEQKPSYRSPGADASAAPAMSPFLTSPSVVPRAREFYRSPSVPPPAPLPAPVRGKMDTLRPPLTSGGAPPPPSGFELQPSEAEVESVPVVYDDTGWPAVTADAFPDIPSSLPPPTQPVRRAMPGTDDFAGTGDGHPFSNEDSYPGPRRRHVGGWVVSLVLLMALGVVGWAVAKPYLVAREAREANATTAQLDPRTQSFLSQGEQAMADGSLDVAQEDFDKASALADRDARVLLDEARVVAAKADIPWLKLRLLPPDATDEIRTTRSQFDDLIVRVRRTADDALAAMPDDIAAVRSKIDALRLEGDRDTARASVSRLSGQAFQPETAYVLAALDLDEAAPLWTTLLDRLRVAAAAEGNAGRAQAALIYALAKSGDGLGAKAELLKIDARARPYPLLPALHAFVEKVSSPAAEAPSASSPPRPEPPAKPSAPRAAPPFVAAAAPYDNGDSADPRIAMQAAALALKRADFARARQIYEGIVNRNPSDSEAIAGLGDVARLQGDTTEAIASYKRAIAVNPSFLPALLGLADTEWANGDRAGAARTYTGVIDHFPEGTYPAYVSQRSVAATAPASEPNGLSESAGTTAAPSSAPDERTE